MEGSITHAGSGGVVDDWRFLARDPEAEEVFALASRARRGELDHVLARRKAGRRPVVLVPNPYYLVYNGAAAMAGADAVFLDATRENGFMPDLAAIPRETLERTALFYLCSPANPQVTF